MESTGECAVIKMHPLGPRGGAYNVSELGYKLSLGAASPTNQRSQNSRLQIEHTVQIAKSDQTRSLI